MFRASRRARGIGYCCVLRLSRLHDLCQFEDGLRLAVDREAVFVVVLLCRAWR